MRKKEYTIFFIFLALISFMNSASKSLAQNSPLVGTAGANASLQPRYLVDIPTAGLLLRSAIAFDLDFFQNGGVLARLSAGALDRVTFGISYGGRNIVGSGKLRFNPVPGVNIKWRVYDEDFILPGIAVGFDSQGKESYVDSTNRYTIKSPGFFITGSKNYELLGNLSVHGGLNYSLEHGDDDKDMNAFIGAEKSLGKEISLVAEYNFGLNDDGQRSLGQGKGYLNAGVRWSFGGGFTLGLDLKNLVKNQSQISVGNRILKIEYVKLP